MKKEDEELKIETLDEKQEAIMSLYRAVSRIFIDKLIKEKLSKKKKKDINNS